jgi:hypothetical protein
MRTPKSWKRQIESVKKKKCGGAIVTAETANRWIVTGEWGVGEEKSAIGGGEYDVKGATESDEGESESKTNFNGDNRAGEQGAGQWNLMPIIIVYDTSTIFKLLFSIFYN